MKKDTTICAATNRNTWSSGAPMGHGNGRVRVEQSVLTYRVVQETPVEIGRTREDCSTQCSLHASINRASVTSNYLV